LATGAVCHPTPPRTEVLKFGLRPSKQAPMPQLQGLQVFAAPGRHGEPLLAVQAIGQPLLSKRSAHCSPDDTGMGGRTMQNTERTSTHGDEAAGQAFR